MEHEKLIQEFNGLPPLAQRQVFDFVTFLRNRHRQPWEKHQTEKNTLADEPFVGMWKNREDLADSTSWVRNLLHHFVSP